MKKIILASVLLAASLFAKECSPYFNPEKFYETPDFLSDLIDENLGNLELFGKKQNYSKLMFKEKNKNEFVNNSIKYNQLEFPKKSGLYSFKTIGDKVDELAIASVNLYRYSDMEIAEEINNDFEGFWNDWIEDGYEMQLVPEQVLFNYKDKYFSFSVYIYGIKKDATKLKGTTIKYWFKDYTKQVNEYISCIEKK